MDKSKSVVRNVGNPPDDVWEALAEQRLTLEQCRRGAAWAFLKMPRSRRAHALFNLFQSAIKVKA